MKKQTKAITFNQYETVSPATKLLQKRRKMYEVHQQFQSKKEEFKNQQEAFKAGQEEIKEKDKQLQQKLTDFCQFLQQNQSKRKKAEQRFRQQQKTYLQKEETIRNLDRQIEQLTKNQKKYMNRVLHLRKYEDYLEKVRSTYNDQYPEMSDILTRYQTLKKSNDDRIRERELMEANHQTLKRQTLTEEKKFNQSILTINNEIKELSRKIQDKIHQKNEVQSQVEQSNEEFSKKNLNLGKIFMAIDNLHYRCNQNSYKVKYEFDDKNTGQKKEIKVKKIEQEFNAKNDQEISYQQRSKYAAIKLKNILSHMKDFKAIIDDYRTATKHAKQQKGEKY